MMSAASSSVISVMSSSLKGATLTLKEVQLQEQQLLGLMQSILSLVLTPVLTPCVTNENFAHKQNHFLVSF